MVIGDMTIPHYGLDAPALVVLGMRPVARANSFSGFHAAADLQPSETTASTIAFD